MIWRERALEARRLGEAFKANVEDLRLLVDVLTERLELSAGAPDEADRDPAEPAPPDDHGDDQPAEPATAGDDGPDELPVVRWSPTPEVPESTNGDTTGGPADEPEPPVRPEPEASRPTDVDRYRYPPARPTLGQSLAARSTKFARLVTRTFGRPSSAPDAR
jgi:hypothetical protein